MRFRTNFAVRFGDIGDEKAANVSDTDLVREAFNSPFWPFVLATTSVGQEGLDFHQYCHAVVHWNLPANPVDLEQREGRVHRYKGHAIRKNLAAMYCGRNCRPTAMPTLGGALSGEARGWSRRHGALLDLPDRGAPHAAIERHVPALPLSKDEQRLRRACATRSPSTAWSSVNPAGRLGQLFTEPGPRGAGRGPPAGGADRPTPAGAWTMMNMIR